MSRSDFDPSKLVSVIPEKRPFKMLVKPGYHEQHYQNNAYETFTADTLLTRIHKAEYFIDIGAHFGYYTLLVGTGNQKCKILSFEPMPESFEILKCNKQYNDLRNVELFNIAISDSERTKKFYTTEICSRSSFYYQDWERPIKEIDVQTARLDNFIAGIPVDSSVIVKIDTEGHEPCILKGMTKLLTEYPNLDLVIEFNPQCLINAGYDPEQFLRDIDGFGFDIYFLDDAGRTSYKLERKKFSKWEEYLSKSVHPNWSNALCIKKDKSLSICFFSHSVTLAGAERSLLELVTELIQDHGVVCTVILPEDGPLKIKLEKAGAATLIVPYLWWGDLTQYTSNVNSSMLTSFEATLRNMLQRLGKINPDVIFTNTMVIPWGAITASFLSKPHVWFVREFGIMDYGIRFFRPFESVLDFITSTSNIVLTNSDAVRKTLFGATTAKNIMTAYMHIDISADAISQDENHYFMIADSTKLVISGPVNEAKGQSDAILAIKGLINRNLNVELIVMGGDLTEYASLLKKTVKDEGLDARVQFIGFKENPYAVINQADIVLVCSRNEAFGRVALEAMLLKKPVIGTNSGGTPELVNDGYNGLLYSHGNYMQLADKIEYLIQHKSLLKKYGENGYKFACNKFTKEAYGGKIFKLLKGLKGDTNPLASPYFNFISELVKGVCSDLEEKMYRIGELEQTVTEKQAHVVELEQAVTSRDVHVNKLQQGVIASDEQISGLVQTIAEKKAHVVELEQAVTSRDVHVNILQQGVIASDEQISGLVQTITEKKAHVVELENAVWQRDLKIEEIYSSISWRISAPLRFIYRSVKAPIVRKNSPPRRVSLIWHLLKEALLHPNIMILRIKQAEIILRQGGIKKLLSTLNNLNSQKMDFVQTAPGTSQPITAVANKDPDWQDYELLLMKIKDYYNNSFSSLYLKTPVLIQIKEGNLLSCAATLNFPNIDSPEVSIIIPAYNNERITLECLASIQQNTVSVDYEIIIVDDGSADKLGQVLSKVKNIIYVKNENNIGFIAACNRGAQIAKGAYIVFLNNDVQVNVDWLQPLIDTIKHDSTVGAVGPKVIYPDGRLQEAGVYIRQDISADMIGLHSDPGLARYNYSREVEYCSGVCLLVKREIFLELGGFDIDYAPAYCEDADLCFKLRNKGLKILYNPKSKIIHYLSATTDTLDNEFKQKCITRNTQIFAERWQKEVDELKKIRLVAFYLPQYHSIPENDLWWGIGFTDWKNVSKAKPNYAGHYQPHIPSDLGYYDLQDEEIMVRQAELAKKYGIYGFCYYYYWFAGKRLLEMPIERMLKTGKPDIPFCLCWANENWTRTWDGKEDDVLIGQKHSDEDDRAVIKDLIRYMQHPNYIRINGKPLLLVYRIGLFPDIVRTQAIWRTTCREEGIGEIYLAFVESFELAREYVQPSKYGFDASVEFPPHEMALPISLPGEKLNPKYNGVVSDYRELILRYVQKEVPGYTRFRTVMAGWDSTPRHPDNAYIFANSTPGAYQTWLEFMLRQTCEQNFGDERIVFVNAWNEWAEGAHLEPDKRFGHGFLEATRNALEKAKYSPLI